MKKHIFTILIIIISIVFFWFNLQKPVLYRVIDVKSSDNLCIDFNSNSKCEKSEIVKLFGIN